MGSLWIIRESPRQGDMIGNLRYGIDGRLRNEPLEAAVLAGVTTLAGYRLSTKDDAVQQREVIIIEHPQSWNVATRGT